MAGFNFQGFNLAYEERGTGPRPIVLLHGLLLDGKLFGHVADTLAQHGYRTIVLELLGHGQSDKPTEMWRYSMPIFAEQVVALLDHLEIESAVIGGLSLGTNVALEVADTAPDRVKGLVVEMPVLDNALLAGALGFTPILAALTLGAPLTRLLARAVRKVPRGAGAAVDIPLDLLSQDPRPSSAILQGLFFGRIAPPRDARRKIDKPTLVIGHRRDIVHPFSDAQMLATELPRGRLIEADSILEFRLKPERLTNEVLRFLKECWREPKAQRAAAAGRRRSP